MRCKSKRGLAHWLSWLLRSGRPSIRKWPIICDYLDTLPRPQPQHDPRLVRTCGARAVARQFLGCDFHQLGVALRQALARDADVVLEPGAHAFGLARQRPFH